MLVGLLIGGVAILAVVSALLFFPDRFRLVGAQFYIRGQKAGLAAPEISALRKAAIDVGLSEPLSVFESVKSLDACIKRVVATNRIKGLEKDEKVLALQSKLLEYRKKIELELPKYKSGLKSSRQIEEGQQVKMLVQGLGAFPSTVTDNSERYFTVTCPAIARSSEEFGWKGKRVSVYFWRRDDAGYVFDTFVFDYLVSGNLSLLRLAHSDSLFRSQKRKSVRSRTKLPGHLYLVKRFEGAYERPESVPGMRCVIEDVSEAGAAVFIGGKAKPGLKMKVQFRLGDGQVVMSGTAKGVDYDSKKNQSRIHFQALAPSRHTRDILLGYVFNILSDGRETGPKNA